MSSSRAKHSGEINTWKMDKQSDVNTDGHMGGSVNLLIGQPKILTG